MKIRKTTNMKTIASELGVSINTVSRALRDCDDISAATKKKVRDKAIELGYMRNFISNFIGREEKHLIALVFNKFENLFFNVMCSKYAKEIVKAGYDFTIIYSNAPKMNMDTLKQCISQRVDFIICLCEIEQEVLEHSTFNNRIISTIETLHEITSVCVNNDESGMLAANYLLNFHKSKKFIFLGVEGVLTSQLRFEAFSKTIHENLKDAEVLLINVNNPKNYDITKYIYKGYMNVFCYNDEHAYKMLDVLNKKIPNIRKVFPSFHIIGHDAISTAIPGLIDITSISFDYDEYISKTVEFIKENIKKESKEIKRIKLRPALHMRTII